jgi:hypothetical protein
VENQNDNNSETEAGKISFVTYRDEEVAVAPNGPQRGRTELFRRPYESGVQDRPREREKRIKFEVVDDSDAGARKLAGFNPYDSTAPTKRSPRR